MIASVAQFAAIGTGNVVNIEKALSEQPLEVDSRGKSFPTFSLVCLVNCKNSALLSDLNCNIHFYYGTVEFPLFLILRRDQSVLMVVSVIFRRACLDVSATEGPWIVRLPLLFIWIWHNKTYHRRPSDHSTS